MSFKMHVVKTRMHITKCISCPSSVTGGFKPNVFLLLGSTLDKGHRQRGSWIGGGNRHVSYVCLSSFLVDIGSGSG